ncbi:MAG: phytoene desaturase family protein [bacterium]
MEKNKQKKVIVIGAGIGGIATACLLAKKGYSVTVLEKNSKPGGRATIFEEKGYMFDMGPSWYMMPDIFEHFFMLMEEKITDHLSLKRLSPSYRIFLKSERKHYDFYSDLEKTVETFESLEKGSGEVLRDYMKTTEYQYKIARDEFMFKNYDSIFDFLNKRVMTEGRKLPLFSKVEKIINSKFNSEILRKVLQYQTVLLGTSPGDAPGIYSMMNYVDFVEGVWYPDGGIYKLIEAMVNIAEKNKVSIQTNSPVSRIIVQDGEARGVLMEDGRTIDADIVVSNADIVHTDQVLLEKPYRQKSPSYWDKRLMAPSAFILYLGIDGVIPSLQHHNLLFAQDWTKNFSQIFKKPEWPTDPSLYVCAPSKSDPSVAPVGKENLFVLVPIAAGLTHTDESLKEYADKTISQMEEYMDIPNLKSRIEFQRIYAVNDFIKDYNAFKGSALGLAHSLGQTAIFRPNNINKKVKNLYYVGAGTNPGIGMPICLISAELVYKRIEKITDPAPLGKI